MTARHPRLWLMTDERQGDTLWNALDALPRGAGVIFRHYGLPMKERRAMFMKVRAVARRRGLLLLLAGPPKLARAWRADGFHGPYPRGGAYFHTASAHGRSEIVRAARLGADLVLASPVHATRSHPDARTLGRVRFGLMILNPARPIIALGGMTSRRARALDPMGIHGWAGIDGLTPVRIRT